MRKGDDGGKKGKKEKIKMFLVATNVVASRPPERRPTATPTACAKIRAEAEDSIHLIVQELAMI